MTAEQRRSAILSQLEESEQPLSATVLAQTYGVTRQIIVGDVALLRAAGSRIAATARGYRMERSTAGLFRRLACRHSAADTAVELNAIVDCGCTVVDVTVEHPVYGEITAALQLSSRYDVEQFINRMNSAGASPLSSLTEGAHLHTVLCPDEERYARLCAALQELGVLFSGRD